VSRPGFAIEYQPSGKMARKLLTGKSARIVVSMGMPTLIYRWFFLAHSVKNLQRNILGSSGIKPIRSTLIGSIEGLTDRQRADWLDTLRSAGEEGQ